MPAKIYYDKDADLALLKNKTIAILGYGSQGHAHAQNLRDSGCTVIVAELPGTPNGDLAVKDGFTPISAAEATKKADVLTLLLPDELQGEIFRTQIRDNLAPGKVIVCSHGFNVHYGQFDVPKGVSIILVAPKGPGHLLRAEFVRGAGVPCLIAVGEGSSQRGLRHRHGVCQGHRRHAGRRDRDHVRRRDRDRPVRRAGRALRRRERTDEGRFRDARRGRLPARNGLFRVHPRDEIDRRPDLPGRPELHAATAFPTRPSTATTPAARGSLRRKPRPR